MEKNCNGIIYMSTNIINGKQYVGQTIREFIIRKKEHINYAKEGRGFSGALHKYGKDKFTWEILIEKRCTRDELNNLEIFFIGYHNTFEQGYNLTPGGNNIITDEICKLMSQNRPSYTGKLNPNYGKKADEETKKKMSKAKKGMYFGKNNPNYGGNKGKKNPMYGKNHSEESLNLMSKNRKGIGKGKKWFTNINNEHLICFENDERLNNGRWQKGMNWK